MDFLAQMLPFTPICCLLLLAFFDLTGFIVKPGGPSVCPESFLLLQKVGDLYFALSKVLLGFKVGQLSNLYHCQMAMVSELIDFMSECRDKLVSRLEDMYCSPIFNKL